MKVQKNRRVPLGQIIFRGRFLFLLIYLLVLIAIQPLDEAIGNLGVFLHCCNGNSYICHLCCQREAKTNGNRDFTCRTVADRNMGQTALGTQMASNS